MFEVLTTDEFDHGLSEVADEGARTKIASRVARLRFGDAGDVKYYKQSGKTIIVILCSGDKSTQGKDIERAKEMAAEL